jgi:DNA-binding CsgD family transcriptional regulator
LFLFTEGETHGIFFLSDTDQSFDRIDDIGVWMQHLVLDLIDAMRYIPTQVVGGDHLNAVLQKATQKQLRLAISIPFDQSAPPSSANATAHVFATVEYSGIVFGKLFIYDRPHQEVCNYQIASRLADLCGWLLFMQRQVNFVQSRLTIDLAAMQERLNRLAPQEWKIVKALVQGLAPSAIARKLHITAGTLRTHQQRIFSKLGIGDTQQICMALALLGIPVWEAKEGDEGKDAAVKPPGTERRIPPGWDVPI